MNVMPAEYTQDAIGCQRYWRIRRFLQQALTAAKILSILASSIAL
jgi:hypothetical protein